jgi:hypothetical protein
VREAGAAAMKLHLDGVAAAALVAAGVAMADPAAAEPQVGLVALLDYQGAIGTRTSGEARELRYQAVVYADERVETDATGATRLLFLDDTSLSVGARSAVILDKFIYDPASRRGDVAIDWRLYQVYNRPSISSAAASASSPATSRTRKRSRCARRPRACRSAAPTWSFTSSTTAPARSRCGRERWMSRSAASASRYGSMSGNR